MTAVLLVSAPTLSLKPYWVYSWILYSFYLSDLIYSLLMLGECWEAWVSPKLTFRLYTDYILKEPASSSLSVFLFFFSFWISQSIKRYGRDQFIAIFHAEGAANCIFWERWCSPYYSLWVRNTISKNSELWILVMKNTGENCDWENYWCWNLGRIPV